MLMKCSTFFDSAVSNSDGETEKIEVFKVTQDRLLSHTQMQIHNHTHLVHIRTVTLATSTLHPQSQEAR